MKVNNPLKYGYPRDNSYCICLTDDKIKNPFLAGTSTIERKLVNIISSPYTQSIQGFYNEHEYEFVNVLYEGIKYRVLNDFTDSKDDHINIFNPLGI